MGWFDAGASAAAGALAGRTGALEGGKEGETPPPRPPQQLTVDSRNLARHDSSGGRPAR